MIECWGPRTIIAAIGWAGSFLFGILSSVRAPLNNNNNIYVCLFECSHLSLSLIAPSRIAQEAADHRRRAEGLLRRKLLRKSMDAWLLVRRDWDLLWKSKKILTAWSKLDAIYTHFYIRLVQIEVDSGIGKWEWLISGYNKKMKENTCRGYLMSRFPPNYSLCSCERWPCRARP